MAKNKSGVMLAVAAAALAVVFLMPSCGNRTKKASSEFEQTTLVREGDTAPDFTVEMFDGSRVALSDLRDQVVLLNFWATWCPPCREELSRVETELIERFSGRDFIFLPVSRGETRQAVGEFLDKMGYIFPVGLDHEQAIYNLYATNYIPRNFLIGKDGKVVLATMGYEPEEFDALIETIEKILE